VPRVTALMRMALLYAAATSIGRFTLNELSDLSRRLNPLQPRTCFEEARHARVGAPASGPAFVR
jgi:hypothetical protein